MVLLQLPRERGCPWGEWTCSDGAPEGHLAILQWAQGQGCPWEALIHSNNASMWLGRASTWWLSG